MSIHLDTLIFAMINFFVLLLIFKKFMFGPICGILDKRKEEIENNLNSAEQAKLEAQKLKDEYASQIKNARAEAQDIINQATKISEQTKADIVNEAKQEAAKVSAKAQEEITREKTQALNELRGEVANLAVLAAAKIVGKSIDVKDHENMVNNFVKEVGEAK